VGRPVTKYILLTILVGGILEKKMLFTQTLHRAHVKVCWLFIALETKHSYIMITTIS
jgi:hypothetical protein